jgi:CBS domain containing-hemolysin-like protein
MALLLSFVCSIAEAVLLSITPAYIAGLQKGSPNLAKLLRRLKQENVDQSLAAILTLNTIAHTVGAIGSGAKATVVFGSAWFGLFSALMTLMILFLSEIIPKTLGAVYWRHLAGITAYLVRGLIVTLYPLIWLSDKLTKLIAGSSRPHTFKREEFLAMAGFGAQSGQIRSDESRILTNLFRLESLRAVDVMTPRTVIAALPQHMTTGQALETKSHIGFSRLPLYVTDIDDIIGFVLKDDLLLAKAQGRDGVTLESFKRDILTVSGQMPLSGLLETLLDHRQHIALVVDPYGGTEGIVTLEDVVETLLGLEIVDEMDTVEDMQALARAQWEKRAKNMGFQANAPASPAAFFKPTAPKADVDLK